eukprot:TRINITY_DN58504_c0_g1_i1.p1 TRINITY_DN58504_c0_g1~~TRINITY_DN58504_c0_g1_i1.p1  ORF type:complete len:349 (-),score=67.27 TRINITY_DN58504_c0_g1_i1:362-1408(-)
MALKQVTNVVYAMLPCRDDFDQALEVMRSFGEIGGVNAVENGHGLLEVAYYDVRAAETAMEALGDVQCWQAAPCGSRTVRLPGAMGLDKTVVGKIFDMRVDDTDENFYILEFYDIRDAAHHREQARQKAQPSSKNKKKQKVRPDRADEQELPTLSPGTYAVLVSGLPRDILTETLIQVVLEQAGLHSDVLSFTIRKGVPTGEAVLIMSSELGVQRCLYHFQGCCWGGQATLINANPSIDANEEMMRDLGDIDEALLRQMEAREDLERGDDWANHETFGTAALESWSYEEQVAANAVLPHLPLPRFVSTKEPCPTSEASTDLSESDGDEQTHNTCCEEPLQVEPALLVA